MLLLNIYSNTSLNKLRTVANTLLLLAACPLYAQDCDLTLSGKIVNMHDNAPLEAAVVQVEETNQNVVSAKDGTFVIDRLCAGKLTLVVSHMNCKDQIEYIDFVSSTSINILMDHHIEFLDEVIINTDQTNDVAPTTQLIQLTEDEKERYSGDGLAKTIAQFSGVSTLSTGIGLAKPIIHGMFGSRIGIVYDQTVLENQQWGQDHAPNIDTNAFDNIRVVKGAATLQYTGDNPGGLVILESKSPSAIDDMFGKTILNTTSNNNGLSLLSSLTRSYGNGIYIKAQGTYKNYGDSRAPDYVLSNTALNENNLSLTVGKNDSQNDWKLFMSVFNNEVGILRSSHVGSLRDLYQSISSDTPRVVTAYSHDVNAPKQSNDHLTANLQYTRTTATNNKWKFKYSWQKNNRKEFDVRRGEYKNIASLDIDLSTHNAQVDHEWTGTNTSVLTGVFAQVQDNTSNPNTGVKRLIPDYIKFKTGSYLTALMKPDRLTIGVGIRFEHYNNEVQKYYMLSRWNDQNYEQHLGKYVTRELFDQRLIRRRMFFNTVSLHGGVLFDISSTQQIGLNYSMSQRAPDIAELFSDGLHHSLATIEYGNPFLLEETNHKFVLDIVKKRRDFQFNISPYLNIGKNYIIIEPVSAELTVRGAFPVWEFRAVDATFKGVDIDLSYIPTKGILLKNNTSWIVAKERISKEPLISIPPLSLHHSIVISPSRWESFSFEINAKNVFRQNQYPNHNFELDIVEDRQYVTKTVDISTPPASYHLVGANLKWGPYEFLSSKLNISLSIDNMFNSSYRNYLNRLRYYADEQGRNLLLQIKFSY